MLLYSRTTLTPEQPLLPNNPYSRTTLTPEQPLLPNNPTLTADGGGHTDTDEGILMAVREAMTNPISRCARKPLPSEVKAAKRPHFASCQYRQASPPVKICGR
ncbi:hypothetical protein DdX_16547 [Ditylenchus destructor]|uniref:Uncharacterized protein n=1 Tax=Ditylenchus destructor TaxID=166010 RepID=A0AAD4MNS8_9BILA|nr:hypothetical protein DdX_16547 [Ditylenchus destructor]